MADDTASGAGPVLKKNEGHLLRNIVLFGRMLRVAGMKVTPTQILDVVEGLKYIDLRRRQDIKRVQCSICSIPVNVR